MTNVSAMPAGITGKPARFPMTPARWLTLVLGGPVLLALIGFVAFSAVAQLGQASFPVSYTFPANVAQVTAQVQGGDITLRQAAVRTPQLSGTAHYSLFRSTLTPSGSTLRYHCPFPLGNCELNATLKVPARSAVSLSSGGGDVTIPGYNGTLAVSTSGGNVIGGALTGKLQLHTGGGDVNVTSLVDTLGTLSLSTSGGNITSRSVSAAYSDIRTGGGAISVTYRTAPAKLTITTAGGNITLVLPHLASGYLVSASSDGGNVHIDRSVHQDSSASGHVINVHTGGGDINISEAS